jgi:hypothetical protein
LPEHLCSQCCTETAIYSDFEKGWIGDKCIIINVSARAGIVEHVATFPNITVDSGQEYQACVITTKNLDLICKTGFNSPAARPEFVDLSLNTANIARESVEEEE